MSENQEDKAVDGLLREWSMRQRPRDEQTDALQAKIVAALSNADLEGTDLRPSIAHADAGGRSVRRSRAWPWSVAACVAASLVAAWIFYPAQHMPTSPPPVAGGTLEPAQPALALFTDQELHQRGRLFGEMNRVYDGRLAWVSETDGRVEVGLNSPPASGSPATPPLVVRLVVMVQDKAGTGWKPQAHFDVLVRPDHVLQSSSAEDASPRLSLWVHRLPDGNLAVDTDFARALPNGDDLRTTAILRPNEPEVVDSGNTDGVDWKLCQMVATAR